MATYSVIMLPGSWDTEEESFRVAQEVASVAQGMPIDIARLMRTNGFAAQKLRNQDAAMTIATAVNDMGHHARVIMDHRELFKYPELRFANRIALQQGDGFPYAAGVHKDLLQHEEILFVHLSHYDAGAATSATRIQRNVGGSVKLTPAEVEARDAKRRDSLCIDVHVRQPRVILRMDLGTTRYILPDLGATEPRLAKLDEVLPTLGRLLRHKVFFPDARLVTADIGDPLWHQAAVRNQASQRSRATWYRQLSESGLMHEVSKLMQPVAVSDQAPSATAGTVVVGGDGAPAAPPVEEKGGGLTRPLPSASDTYVDQVAAAEKWLKRGLLRRALKEADRAVEMGRERPEGYRVRALIHEAMGDAAAARKDQELADRLAS